MHRWKALLKRLGEGDFLKRKMLNVAGVIGFLIVLVSAGYSDAGAPLAPCALSACLGLMLTTVAVLSNCGK